MESIDIDVTNCDASNNGESGIYIWDSPDCEITNCNIYNNNEYGVQMSWGAYDNLVYHNNFINNPIQGGDQESSSQWDNDYPSGGNYWNDYTGEDDYSGPDQDIPGSDGIGDTPYAISGNQDNYPLMEPIGDTTSPAISGIILTTSDPIDTDPLYGWENVTCTVTDLEVRDVKLVVTDFDTITTEYPMINIPDTDTYYCNTTITQHGVYNYSIWAEDVSLNNATSASEPFELPPNWDVNMDGRGHLQDFVLVAGHYSEYGPYNGWIREDVNNDGRVHLQDFVLIAGHYNEYWK